MIPLVRAGLGPDEIAVIACVAIAGGALAPLRAQAPAGFDRVWRPIAQQFHGRAEAEGIVGGSVWLAHDGVVLAREFHGFADLATQRRVDENTVYHWASITKTFTGIAIMQLRDRGRLNLDDPVVRYIPELRSVHNPFGSMEAVTIRHLLSHSAGFRAPTWPWGGDQPWHPHEPKQWEQLVAMMPYTEILFEPGSRFGYSNPGIVFLGRIIELLTGDDFEVYVDKNILDPLEMYRTYFDVTPYHLLPYRSNNFTVLGDSVVAGGLDFDTGITTSNGGLNAPLTDMVRYLSFLMGVGDRERNAAVLQRSTLEEMWRPVVPVRGPGDSTFTARESLGWKESVGLTFFLSEYGGTTIVGHTGSQKSFRTFFWLDPVRRTAAIGALNTVGDPLPATDALIRDITLRLFETVFPLFR